jgi:multiple antibiotic resistance protein
MELAALIPAFVTLFVVIDPIGLAPLFVAITQGMSNTARRAIAIRACLVAIGLLAVFAVFGESVLEFIGVSLDAFRISGGVLLFLTALDMLFNRRQERREDQAEGAAPAAEEDPSVFPIAIPLIAGPGAIATVILLTGQSEGVVGVLTVLGITSAVVAMVFLMFLAAGPLERALGKTGINVVTRLLGMLLAALSVQFILDGLASFGLGLG